MQKKAMLIINPVSGKGQAKSALFSVVSAITDSGFMPTVFITRKSEDATRFAAEYAAQFDRVICLGGDGTLSEVIAGLMELEPENRPIIGYIPTGTANDVASTLKIPRRSAKSMVTALGDIVMPYDVGKFGDEYFTYIAAFGAFTKVSYSTPQDSKKAFGHMAYIFEGIASLRDINPIHTVVEFDDERLEDDYIFGAVTNSTSVAGLVKLDPTDVSLSDGMFEVILVKMPKTIVDLNDIVSALYQRKFENKSMVLFHTNKVRFTFDSPVGWTRDGERGGEIREVTLENLKHAVKIAVPEGGIIVESDEQELDSFDI